MPGLLDFRKLWPNDFAMEPQPVFADKEAERAGQLLTSASEDKYGSPDPTFSFSHLSDYVAGAAEKLNEIAPPKPLGQSFFRSEGAKPPPEPDNGGFLGRLKDVGSNALGIVNDIQNPVQSVIGIGKDVAGGNLPGSSLAADARDMFTSATGLDQSAGQHISGPVLNSFLDQSGNVDTNPANLPGNVLSAATQANPVARTIRGAILGENPYGGQSVAAFNRFQQSDAPEGLKTAANFATPGAFVGGGAVGGMRAAIGGIAGAGAADQVAASSGAPDWVRTAAPIAGAVVGGAVAHDPQAVAALGKRIFGEGGPLGGEAGGGAFHPDAPNPERPGFTMGGKPIEPHPTASELGGPAPTAPGAAPLTPEQELVQKAIRSSEQMDPMRNAERRALRANQGSGYYDEYKRALERTGDPAAAHEIATQATAGTAGFTQAADTIPATAASTLREKVLAARERDVNPINDFEMRRANIMLAEAEQAGSRALGPQNERDLWAKIVGLTPEGDVNFPIDNVRNPATTIPMDLGDLTRPAEPPLLGESGMSLPEHGKMAGEVPYFRQGEPVRPPGVSDARPGASDLALGDQPLVTPEGAIATPQPGAIPAQPMTTEAIHGPTGRAAVPEPGIYDASRGWGPATPAELADPGVMASRRALVERQIGVDARTPEQIALANELAAQDAAAAAARAPAAEPVSPLRRGYNAATGVANAGIPAKAGLDVSYVLRQSLPLLARDVLLARDFNAAKAAFQAGWSALRHPETAAALRETIAADPYFKVIAEDMKVPLNSFATSNAARDDALVHGFFNKGKYNPFRVTEQANELYLDTLRFESAKKILQSMIDKAAIEGITIQPPELEQVGKAISHGTGKGTGSLVNWLSNAPVRPLFSAQNLMAKPQMITDAIRLGGPAKSLAIEQLIGYGSAVAGFNTLVWAPVLMGLPHADIGVSRKPEDLFGLFDGNFMRAQLGANSVDLSGGGAGNLRSAAQFLGSVSSAAGGPGYEGASTSDISQKWVRGKLSPIMAFVTDNVIAHKNYDDTPVDWKSFGGIATQLNNMFGTLSVNDIVNVAQTEMGGRDTLGGDVKGALSTFALGALATLGAGLNSGLTPSEQLREARDKATAAANITDPATGKKITSYDDLPGAQKAIINQRPEIQGFQSQVDTAPGNKIGEINRSFSDAMDVAKKAFTTTAPDGKVQVTDGVGYRHAYQDAAKSKHDQLLGAGAGEGKDDILNGWYALYNDPAIKEQLLLKDYSGIDAAQAKYTADHPEVLDKLAKSVGAKDTEIMAEMRQGAEQAKRYYAIPKYVGLSEQEANRADAIIAKASSMTQNGQAPNSATALGQLMRDGTAVAGKPVSPEDYGLVQRAKQLGTNIERKKFQLDPANHWFSVFYKGADESLGDIGTVPAGAGSSSLFSGGDSGGNSFKRNPTPTSRR